MKLKYDKHPTNGYGRIAGGNPHRIALFWISYILTRPLGAAGADLLGKPKEKGGLGLGDGTTSLISLVVIIGLIIYLTITHKKEMLDEELSDRSSTSRKSI